ncbi:phage tail protein [Thalassococcus sp. BH17M4-6]|uniref:phage tail protein n=1 Tax=Thalassococcus sp. BH17M4-6 TaxID=3413148 RepID=UPI003BE8969B
MANYYPPVAFAFSVRIAGNRAGVDSAFQEVSGLTAERTLEDVPEGGENRFVHRVPGQVKQQNLVLKRGMVLTASPLFDWCKTTLESDLASRIQVKDLTVALLDQKQKPVIGWSVVRAWPVKWQVGNFDAKENAVLIETIELSFQRIERKLERQLGPEGFFA